MNLSLALSVIALTALLPLEGSLMTKRLYKVVAAEIWRQAVLDGQFQGAGIDLRDGFIHLSAPDQVIETVETHFAGQEGLLLITVDATRLGSDLRWESSRAGALFPHLYGVIPMSAVERTDPLPVDETGTHQFPF